MSTINSIRIRNLRSFGNNSKFIPINDINVYVGKNSSGKSTFARLFPLLRQSIEEKTKGPILWYGNYVDFGDFKSAVNINNKAEEIYFDFNIEIHNQHESYREFTTSSGLIVFKQSKFHSDAMISIGVKNEQNKSSASSVFISIENSKLNINLQGDKITRLIASNANLNLVEEFSCEYGLYPGSILPNLYHNTNDLASRFSNTYMPEEVKASLCKYIMQFHHKNKQSDSVMDIINRMSLMSRKSCYEFFKKEFSSNKQFIKNIKGKEEEFTETVHLHNIACHVQHIVKMSNNVLADFFSGVRYMGPIRAAAERYYRYQDLQIDEIDHLGSNLPMILSSLSKNQKNKLTKWTKDNFGFSLDISESGSHYAIKIKEEDSQDYFNISDMGFGYSQILPIVVSVWLERENQNSTSRKVRRNSNKNSLIVIEQPELHLHPMLQYKFARAIANLSSMLGDKSIRFIFETHSNHIIDGLGDSISEGKISSDNITITLFSKDLQGTTITESSGFDSEGYLTNWPAGFLSA
ncbi:AAA family ATPase [Cobetia sp. 3AK]|uniref:AAA family ATPase n=1 Tax=Cobetia sp. 3AK TaxID=3040020 RepID=UPI00244A1BCD|nr:AAA family ATPase [Cobetia sp. 3AK]MDH2373604.1 AAA family ATPase [Cobetia sp. 3AK]